MSTVSTTHPPGSPAPRAHWRWRPWLSHRHLHLWYIYGIHSLDGTVQIGGVTGQHLHQVRACMLRKLQHLELLAVKKDVTLKLVSLRLHLLRVWACQGLQCLCVGQSCLVDWVPPPKMYLEAPR